MPATGIRCTMFFSENRGGFSETHVFNNTTIASAVEPFFELCKKRAALCAAPVRFFRGRMSLNGSRRAYQLLDNIQVNQVNQAIGAPIGASDNKADQVKACVLAQMSAGPQYHRNLYLAGVPDVVLREDPETIVVATDATWNARWLAYRDLLITAAWGYIARIPPGGTGPTLYDVLSYTEHPDDGRLGFRLATGTAGYVRLAKVQISGAKMTNKAYHNPNGIWTIGEVDDNNPGGGTSTFYLDASTDVTASAIKVRGKVNLYDVGYQHYTSGTLINMTTRKRGNSFLYGRGRVTKPNKVSP